MAKMPSAVFPGLPRGYYGTILADPPWHFEVWEDNETGQITGRSTRRAEKHYSTMTISGLCDLPVSILAAPDCALFMWIIDTHIERALKVGTAWGFKYKTKAFEWVKTKKDGTGYAFGMGFWTRKQTESCLLFTRGSPKRLDAGVGAIITAPRREHSRKPDEQYEKIERLIAGPYVELFARRYHPGWSSWGNGLAREWRKIRGFDYEVSDDGQVRRIGSEILLSQDLNSEGYFRVDLFIEGIRFRKFVHKLVCNAFHENPDGKPWADHKDRNRQNNLKDNLRWSWKHENNVNRLTNGKFRGISKHQHGGWAAYGSTDDKKTIYLGKRDTPEEAAFLYDIWAAEKYGEFAILNFPEAI
jgi:N6-adenosine-specific RNA methylase IME4